MNERTNYYSMDIQNFYMRNMTTAGATNIINRLASVCDDYGYLLSYRDEATHDCILCFSETERETKL